MSNYQTGTTVRVECNFYNYEDQPTNPQLVQVKIYNQKYEILVTESISNSGEVGHYYYDYTTTDTAGKYYYEFSGEIGGKPYLKRGQIKTRFL